MQFNLGFDLFSFTCWKEKNQGDDCGLLPPPAALCMCFFIIVIIIIHGLMWRGRVSPQASQQSSAQAVWVVPALRQLHEITRSFIKQTYQKQDKVGMTGAS